MCICRCRDRRRRSGTFPEDDGKFNCRVGHNYANFDIVQEQRISGIEGKLEQLMDYITYAIKALPALNFRQLIGSTGDLLLPLPFRRLSL